MSFGAPNMETHTEKGRVANLQDIVGGSQYGAKLALVRGTARLPGNIIWAAKPIEHSKTTTTTTHSSGKGGGGSVTQTVTTYWYTCSFAVAFSRGPVFGLSKIWANGVLFYDLSATASAGSIVASNALLASSLTIYTGTETQAQDSTIASDKGLANTPAYRDRVYIVLRDLDLTQFGNRLPTFTAEVVEFGQLYGGNQITSLKRSVGAVILDLCQLAGIPPARIDVSHLTDELYGIAVGGGNYREAIQYLLDAFAVRPVMSGNVLKFLPSTLATVDAALTGADLGQDQPGRIGTRIKVTRKRDHGLPRKVTLSYCDIARQDERSTQTRPRVAPGGSANDITLDLPLTLDAAGAARICETKLYRAWVERDEYELPLGPKWLALDPGDIITAVDGSTTHQIKLKRIDYGYNGQMKLQGVAYEPAVSVSAATGATGTVSSPTIPDIGATTAYLLDPPALTDTLAGAAICFAAAGGGSGWKTASIFVSTDNGITYSLFGQLPVFSIIGTTVAALPNPPATGAAWWDDVSTVDVDVLRGTLEGASDALLLAGANRALVGNEVIQFGVATLISAGRYRLSRLLRGRRGTEWAMTGHAAGDRFILLDTIGRTIVPLAELNAQRLYKVVPNGKLLTDVGAISYTWTGEVLKPFSGVQAKAVRVAGDITATWIRRSRLGQELPSGTDIPLGETTERYEVEVLSGTGVVLRTITGLITPSVLYTAAQQTTDFGSVQASVRFIIYQLSEAVGRGHGLDVTL